VFVSDPPLAMSTLSCAPAVGRPMDGAGTRAEGVRRLLTQGGADWGHVGCFVKL
jgi:hypothetical protein